MSPSSSAAPDPPAFALALQQMDGVGRVTAGRLLARCSTYEEVLDIPREQVLTRIRGVPNAQDIVHRLFDRPAMEERLREAASTLEALRERGVHLLTMHDEHWPHGANDLPHNRRPFILYAYGHRETLDRPLVGLLARPPLSESAFEQAEALVRHLLAQGLHPATGISNGFDVAVHRRSSAGRHASVLLAPCGLARIDRSLRPTVSAAVRAGGLALSPFPMEHGPYDHDDRERALLLAALAQAVVFVEPRPDTPEEHALRWALEASRPVFGIASAERSLPESVHPLNDAVDADWVVAAARQVPPGDASAPPT